MIPAWRALGLAGKLTAVGIALAIVGAVVLWITTWDPFGAKKRLETRAATAEQQAETSALTVQGAQESAQRVEVVVRTREAVQQSVTAVSRQAQGAPDATQPIPADRADRLRRHDEFLCGLRQVQGCTPATGADAPGR